MRAAFVFAGIVALVLAQAASASPIDKSVRALVEKLELSGVTGFELGADLAIAVSIKGGDEQTQLARVIGGLVRSRLEELGVRSIVIVDGAAISALESSARDRGAEWLLWISGDDAGDRVRLFAQLRAIDRGLWVRPPKPEETSIYATAESELRADDTVRTLIAVEPRVVEPRTTKVEVARFESAPVRAAGIEDRLLAIASCKITAGSTSREVLFAVGVRALYAFGWEGTALRRIATLDLTALPRAKEPSREPVGTAICAKNELWFGHSDLERGQAAYLELGRGEQGLGIARALNGMPLGVLATGKVVFGELERGISRFAKTVRAETAAREVSMPWLDAAFDASLPSGFRVFAVSNQYQLTRFGDELEGEQAIATSGVGGRAFSDGADGVLAVTTSSVSLGDRDRVRLFALDRERGTARKVDTIEVNGAVHATAIAARTLVLAVWRAPARKSELYTIAIGGAQKAASR